MGARLGGRGLAGADGGARRPRAIRRWPPWCASGRTWSPNGRSGTERSSPPCRSRPTSATRAGRGRQRRPGLPPSTRASPTIDKRLASRLPRLCRAGRARSRSPSRTCRPSSRADEALVLFLDTPEWKPTPEETFIWVVTKTDMRWVRSELGTRGADRARWRRCAAGSTQRRWDGDGASAARELLEHRTRQGRRSADAAAALRSRPRARALQGAVRRGRGPDQGQAPADRAVRPADAAAVPGAGDRHARNDSGDWQIRRAWLARRPRHHRAARGLLAQGAAPASPSQQLPTASR